MEDAFHRVPGEELVSRGGDDTAPDRAERGCGWAFPLPQPGNAALPANPRTVLLSWKTVDRLSRTLVRVATGDRFSQDGLSSGHKVIKLDVAWLCVCGGR